MNQFNRLCQVTAATLVRAYQAFLRPLNLWNCKFYPSCSEYALEALRQHGPWAGSWLALRRLLRCRPGRPGGFDPVPEEVATRWPGTPPRARPFGEASG